MGSTSEDYGNYGDRWLAMWFRTNSYKLHIVAGSTYNPNQHIDVGGVQEGIENKIQIMSGDWGIFVYINGKEHELSDSIRNRPGVSYLKFFASDNFYEPADATLKELSFKKLSFFDGWSKDWGGNLW